MNAAVRVIMDMPEPPRPRPRAGDWRTASDAELVAHILARYHAAHRAQLPELIRLARRVEQVHGDREDCPAGLADHLEAMAQALESHMRKEEAVLFPLILRGQGALAAMPMAVMRAEHDGHGAELRRLEALAGGFITPPGACASWQALCQGLRVFRDDLAAHIEIENDVLFARFAPAQAH
ncbi:hemerythrin domain-containing protein [Roseateles sp.]|uniref:hemerythrin domain-containing protein n=1 Tax=Roseateles sp. TaxID=1971397 RepID=UPI0039EB9D55